MGCPEYSQNILFLCQYGDPHKRSKVVTSYCVEKKQNFLKKNIDINYLKIQLLISIRDQNVQVRYVTLFELFSGTYHPKMSI